jgi:NAD-dependent dihydropyrimidine dehydrogenase PreA subunit
VRYTATVAISGGKSLNNIIINKELCNGCKICFKSCFIDVIKWDDKNKKPAAVYPEECVQCLYCELNCPRRAVKVVPDYAAYRFPRENVL